MRSFLYGQFARINNHLGTGTRLGPRHRRTAGRHVAAVTACALVAWLPPAAVVLDSVPAQAAPVDAGFSLDPADLAFVLDQIRIAEHHAATATSSDPCGTLTGDGPNQIPDSGNNAEELPWGLRTVDGVCNNLVPGQERYGAAGQVFPRRVEGRFRDAEIGDPDGPLGPQPPGPTSYKQKSGTVIDSEPRVVSNLIVDQTEKNPAALAASGVDPATVESDDSLSIPHVAPDAGLSAPYNMAFTFFGQFFDHGLDLVSKSGGTVFMPLRRDDPLYREGSHTNFMVLTRATNQPGPDGQMGTPDDVQEATNTTSPFVDQNQTYTSHSSHQVFVREYALDAAGDPVSTGRLLTDGDDGMATWARLKQQSADLLGIQLRDTDVLDVPLLATDPYGRFLPGPNGYPQVVVGNADGTTGLVEGDPAADGGAGLAVPANALRTGQAFLVDIAHHAVPVGDIDHTDGPGQVVPLQPDSDPGTRPDRNADGSPNNATYDDEMLGAHFIAGDGRVNENIGLTAVHHVFHAEHNRLVGHIKDVLVNQADASLAMEYQLGTDATGTPVWNGERLFQAAKLVTEMEYQHLAFEEFARKVQPMVNAFGQGGSGYTTSLDPAIEAEFAHAVYRFGHSMLTETIARRNADGSRNDLSLLGAFLNPPAFTDGGPTPSPDDGAARVRLAPEQAAGSLFRGMSRQVGSEIDEFVTGALRSNLLGLPLDLAAINIARGRDTGTPTLNEARRQFYAESGNSALKPYTSWADFSFSLKRRESLVNFVAAYGTHPSIETENTVAAKRAAAARIIANDPATDPLTPADSADFMNGTGVWATAATGIDDVDLWVGGLAEKRVLFGGLLGSTFNYVFELQMENLQFGDRFYYLSRLAGTNMLSELESNSFAELVMRNTDVRGLPADAFSRPDYVFNVGNLGTSGPITDDPATEEYDESNTQTQPGRDLHRLPDRTIRYTGPAHAVFNGTVGNDRIRSSEGDDTVRGDDGDDWMEGGDGVDSLIGGLGGDIIEDLFGDDVLRGGPGHDALSSGQGLGGDVNQGGAGQDFVVGGNDTTETFAGPGTDFVFAGDSEDTVFGGSGDDWIEGGGGPFNLLQGDHGNPFQDDAKGGHDVLDGDGGEQDFDAEGGDDIMLMGPGIQRAEGMLGFDWTTHKNDPQPADSDMTFTGLNRPSVDALRDRFDLTEALSGWRFDDVLRGDDRMRPVPPAADGGEAQPGTDVEENTEQHTLTEAGIDRIDGLAGILPPGTKSFNTGNILLGGAGDDLIEGRGGDDIIDGDAWLDVQLEAPDPGTLLTTDRQRVDSMGPLRADVFARRIDPGDISVVRRIQTAAPGTSDLDAAVFSDVRANYECRIDGVILLGGCPTEVPAGAQITVTHAAGTRSDGTDTLRNVERLVYAETAPPGVPTNVTATAGDQSATVTWTAPAQGPVEGYRVKVLDASGGQVGPLREAGAEDTSKVVTGLVNGQAYRFQVQAWNAAGNGDFSAASPAVTPSATEEPAPDEPEEPTLPPLPPLPPLPSLELGDQMALLTWSAPADDGGSPLTGYQVRVRDASQRAVRRIAVPADRTRLVVRRLTNGRTYWFGVAAVNEVGASRVAESRGVTPAAVPDAPAIRRAARRNAAAIVRWRAPAPTTGGKAAVSGYRIRVVDASGVRVGGLRRADAAATRRRVGRLDNGSAYRFQVAAVNATGIGRFSRLSNLVTPIGRPDAPRIRRARWGYRGDRVTARAFWRPPADDGGSPITRYRVAALRLDRDSDVVSRRLSRIRHADSRRFNMRLRPGRYRFEVRAYTRQRHSLWSRESNVVRAR